MPSDNLRGRIAEALEECRTLIPVAQANAVMALVQPELDRLAEVRRYCELMADSCHVPSRTTARDILRYLDTGTWKERS